VVSAAVRYALSPIRLAAKILISIQRSQPIIKWKEGTMTNKWEIFNPTDGRPILRVPFKWLAWLITSRSAGLDYAERGDGWIHNG
jgi:hypothetical protein